MAERIIEQDGGGFSPLVPGHFGSFRARLSETNEVLEVVPFGQPFAAERVSDEESTKDGQQDDEQANDKQDEEETPPEQRSNGG